MRLKLFISVLTLLFVSGLDLVWAQTATINHPGWATYVKGNEHIDGIIPIDREVPYDRIEGSPYDNDKFTKGVILMMDNDTMSRFMRINHYTDEMEYAEKGIAKAILNPLAVNRFFLNSKVYKYVRYIDTGGKRNSGYMVELSYGTCILYKKRTIRFKEFEPAKNSYSKGKPDSFDQEYDEFYGVCGNTDIKHISSGKKKIANVLGDNYQFAAKYIKDNKLKLKKEKDLISLFNAINSGK